MNNPFFRSDLDAIDNNESTQIETLNEEVRSLRELMEDLTSRIGRLERASPASSYDDWRY